MGCSGKRQYTFVSANITLRQMNLYEDYDWRSITPQLPHFQLKLRELLFQESRSHSTNNLRQFRKCSCWIRKYANNFFLTITTANCVLTHRNCQNVSTIVLLGIQKNICNIKEKLKKLIVLESWKLSLRLERCLKIIFLYK